MSTRRGPFILAVIAGGFAAASGYLWHELGQERARNADLSARLKAMTPTLESARSAAAAGPIPSPSSPASSPSTPAPPVATASPPQVTGKQEDWEAYQRRMMRDPRYREVQREQTRLALAPRRANLIRLLGMTPAQADAVIDMQIEHEWQQGEQMNNLATEEQRQQQRQRADVQEADYQAKLREMLGGEKHLRLQHYMETRQTRMQVDTFRTHLNGVDSLRDEQVEPLIEALHVERQKMQDELDQFGESLRREGESNDAWQRYGERQIELMKDMHAGMHVSAAAILSSSQLDQLDAMLNRELQRHETNMRMSKLESKLDSSASAAPPAN